MAWILEGVFPSIQAFPIWGGDSKLLYYARIFLIVKISNV